MWTRSSAPRAPSARPLEKTCRGARADLATGDHQSVLGARDGDGNPIGSSGDRSRASTPTSAICARASSRVSSRPTIFCPPRLSSRAQRLLAIEAANQRGVSEADLAASARHLTHPARIDPQPSSSRQAPASIGTADALVAQARGPQRPERRALEDRAAAARERIAAARAESLPRGVDRRRHGLRTARTRGSSRAPAMGGLLGHRGQCDLGDLGRRPQPGGPGRGRRDRPRRPSRACSISIARSPSRSASAGSRWTRVRAAIVAAADGVRAAAGGIPCRRRTLQRGVATNTEVLDAQTALLQAAARSDKGGRQRATPPTHGLRERWDSDDHTLRHLRSSTRRAASASSSPSTIVSFDVRARRDLRLSRQQRRRQVHDDPHAVRAAAADVRHARRSAASTSARSGRREAAHRLHVAALLALRAADRRSEHPVLRRRLRA